MNGGQIIGLVTIILIFGGPMIVGVVYAIVQGWSKTVQHREEVRLKDRLADNGFSVEEIERVVAAGRSSDVKHDDSDIIDDSGYPKSMKVG